MKWWLWCVLVLATWFAGRTQGLLFATINEPGGPFTASGAVILQTESPRNITVVTAHTYEISCSSNMGVTPVWHRNGSLVTNSQPTGGTPGVYVREPTNHERVLVLQNITQSVVGTYVCLEGTSQDADSATFIVTTGNPTAVPGFPQRDLDDGSSWSRVTLHALVSATPPPLGEDVLWYFNGNLIVDRVPPLNILILGPTEISFPRAITTVLMGTYTCVVNTTAGVGTATFRVQVRVQPSLTIIPATNITTLVGMSITISCTDTEGSPAPTITWTHNSGPLEPDGRITITNDTVAQSSQLTITSLRPGDTGTYRCLAVNPRGSVNKEIHVNVQYAPIFSGVSGDPTIWVVDDEVLVTAHLTGSNPPFTSYQLLKDSQLVTSSRIQVTYTNSSSNFTFVIPLVMVSDEGRYTLVVVNPIGVGHINFTIIVYSPPNLGEFRRTFFRGTVGRSITLNLTILDAKPLVQPANVSWMFNNIPIPIDGNKYTQDVTPDMAVLLPSLLEILICWTLEVTEQTSAIFPVTFLSLA